MNRNCNLLHSYSPWQFPLHLASEAEALNDIHRPAGIKVGISVGEDEAIHKYPDLINLITICNEGWAFRALVDGSGELSGIVGSIHRQRYTDAIWIFDPY